MSDDPNLTDGSYELIERLERKKTWLTVIAALCLILAPIGFSMDVFAFMAIIHQKEGVSDVSLLMMAAITVFSSLLLIVGAREYRSVRILKKKLQQVDLFEETVYNEVLKSRMP